MPSETLKDILAYIFEGCPFDSPQDWKHADESGRNRILTAYRAIGMSGKSLEELRQFIDSQLEQD